MSRHQPILLGLAVFGVGISLAGCGAGSDNHAPTAQPASLALAEDSSANGIVHGSDPDGDLLTFSIHISPAHGQATIDQSTGNFTYTPAPDYFGSDSFSFVAFDGKRRSVPATVSLAISNVNDAPTLGTIPDLTNSAYSQDTHYALSVHDVDGDQLTYSVAVADPSIASANVDAVSSMLIVHPIARGATTISLHVADAEFSVERSFDFEIGDVTKSIKPAISDTSSQAIELHNSLDQPVELTLTHNGFTPLLTDADMAEYVAALPALYDGEPFERKLWRYLRDNVYHNVPLDPTAKWVNEPSTVINSLGWGFCSQVASSYVRISRAAGYQAHVYGLSGHVVPEINIGGRWRIYDADLAVYYRDREGEPVGVADVEMDSSLITSPTDPVLSPDASPTPYSQLIADYYTSVADNFDADTTFLPDVPVLPHKFVLPPGARFVYPGHWTAAPIGFDGIVPYQVPHFLQAALGIQNGWVGPIESPWLVWDLQGDGTVRIGSDIVEIGTQAMTDALRSGAGTSGNIEILDARDQVTVIFFVNALGYMLAASNAVDIRGLDVWAVEVSTLALPSVNQVTTVDIDRLRKPTPVNPH